MCVTTQLNRVLSLKLSLNLMKKCLQLKKWQSGELDSRISSVEGQCGNHYAMEPSVIASIFKWHLDLFIITFVEFTELGEFIDNVSWIGKPRANIQESFQKSTIDSYFFHVTFIKKKDVGLRNHHWYSLYWLLASIKYDTEIIKFQRKMSSCFQII